MPSGVRWAETTRTSCGMPNSSSAWAAADMTGQSESLPMITPTNGCPLIRPPSRRTSGLSEHQVLGRGPGPAPDLVQVLAQRGHVADLATRTQPLAVEMDLHVGPGGQAVVDPFVDASRPHVGRTAEQIG